MATFLSRFLGKQRPAHTARRPRRRAPGVELLEARDVPTTFTTLQLHQAATYQLAYINEIRANPAAEAARTGVDLNEGLPAGTISTAAKQPLAPNASLIAAMEGHLAVWINSSAQFANPQGVNPHTDLGDGNQATRATAKGYGSSFVSENLKWNASSADFTDLQALAKSMIDDLYTDSFSSTRGHRTNLLDPQMKEVGIGLLGGIAPSGSAAGMNLVVAGQDFGLVSNGHSFITGVVFQDGNSNGKYDMGEGLANVTVTIKDANGTVIAVGSSRVDLQACKLEYSIVSPK